MQTLSAGSVFTGTVTQSGVMVEDECRFEALQICTLTVTAVDHNDISCDIRRQESKKFVNGSAESRPGVPVYLTNWMNSLDSCLEHAIGTFNPFTSMLIMRSERPDTESSPNTVWSPHLYILLVEGRSLSGPAICTDGLDDRENDIGALKVFLQ
jgi:hypothetical protein